MNSQEILPLEKNYLFLHFNSAIHQLLGFLNSCLGRTFIKGYFHVHFSYVNLLPSFQYVTDSLRILIDQSHIFLLQKLCRLYLKVFIWKQNLFISKQHAIKMFYFNFRKYNYFFNKSFGKEVLIIPLI